MQSRLISLVVLFALACGSKDDRDDGLGGGLGDGGDGGDSGGQNGDDGSGGDDDDGGDGSRFDVAGGTGGPGDNEGAGCEKVDFLFVIDNSGSMSDEQQNLIGSFPGFIDAIRNNVEGQDYHLMVVTTDPKGWPNMGGGGMSSSCNNGNCTCSPVPDCCSGAFVCGGGNAMTCYGFPCGQLDQATVCDYEFGAGQRFGLVEARECLPQGQHYYIDDPAADLDMLFSCIANVGTYGDGNEMPMAAMGQAIDAARNGPGGCNEGFLRDDAVLVVTIITDEEDDNEGGLGATGSPGEPADWAQTLIDAKLGNPDAVVVLGLIGDSDVAGGVCPAGAMPGTGGPGAEASPRLRSFVEMFQNGYAGSVCAADYAPFFEEAVGIIDTACDDFVPPG